jgi:hypothetical protein
MGFANKKEPNNRNVELMVRGSVEYEFA